MSSWGKLFGNRFKGTNKKAPDLTGHITLDGTERAMVAWWKLSHNGRRFLNVEIKDAKSDGEAGPRPLRGPFR